jgi:nucleoid-associated protein YgaU
VTASVPTATPGKPDLTMGPPPPPHMSAGPAVTQASGAAGARVHEVKKGDTLSAIAKEYYGKASDYPKIFEANRDQLKDPDKIFPGQKLKIP